ncbi:lipase family alpha/beta hydrolase [Acinetobacter ursingii]|uniref:lipase family alpha/beta hydrolase n=1 Tax=Acinetobacter ursingii TaxID=108980 RepID=UPI000CF268E9|nr:alpha/beta fold hydrolase [Acinetobacter ursingii]MCU4488122.1 alpha/beta fold hydrolase [Acinetobacter ursingii]MCU4521826.1 alpha/beta fold hydrolase [Acinetobacter ursingii]MCU4601904.1 alpha/beta fold hydrolase [Acinetobacter ursingii]MDH0191964.1 alpha/beta fold hydrolase [Acinetobacter ursingii]PPZ94270.1 alpha/beta hydrolase [Acinetobacter ursingii]
MINFRKKNSTLFLVSALSITLLSGCQVVSVKQQAVNVTIANERNSILMQDKLSEASLNVLSMSGREAKICMDQPTSCVNELKMIPEIVDEQFLSTASELYLAKAMQLDKSSACTVSSITKHRSEEHQRQTQQTYDDCQTEQLKMLDKSIRYSYAYLFKTKRKPIDRIFDNRQVQIRDFYNQAIAKLVTISAQRSSVKKATDSVKIGNSIYNINLDQYQLLKNKELDRFISSYNLNFSGLRTINRRDGFGSEFVAVFPASEEKSNNKYILDPLNASYQTSINPNIHKARYLSATIVARPVKAESVDDIINSPNITVQVMDPYRTENVDIAGKSYPLAANFSAPYGLWLAENNLGAAAYLSLIDREERLTMPHLYMLEPYNPNKKVIVLVHGLASSPEAWIALTNDIMGDSILREHYQVWQVFYSTNMPILESRFQIYALLKQAFGGLNPNDPADKDAVLIGHSMGGIISRLLVSNADISQSALSMMSPYQQAKLKKHPIVSERLKIQPITNFDRAVFMSSPNRGTDFADLWFTRAARKIIKLPGAFLGAVTDTITNQDIDAKDILTRIDKGLIQNGPSDLSHKSKFMALTEDINPPKGFVFHSIIGNKTNSKDPDVMTDGIVPYKSAHLDGATSEVIIKGGHSIQKTPEAVLELRRILRQHLVDHNIK